MKFKQLLIGSVLWRGLYFFSVLLLNVLIARNFEASGSGWLYYITNNFSFILLLISLSIESGMTFFSSKNEISPARLSTLSLIWSGLATILVGLLVLTVYSDPDKTESRQQFLFFTFTYLTGNLLTTFFCALFYARSSFARPNIILTLTNIILAISVAAIFYFGEGPGLQELVLKLYMFNFVVQGMLLAIAYMSQRDITPKFALPDFQNMKMLFRYSSVAFIANILFFLLYRIDYWFVKKICLVCEEGDLGNYIQVSKVGQMFLLLPAIVAGTIFPRTAGGFREQVNMWLPAMVKGILLVYLFVLLILALTGSWLFPLVYGSSFSEIYIPFLFLIPGILSLSGIALMSAYNSGKDKVSTNLKCCLIGLIFIVIGDLIFIPRYGIYGAAAVSSIAYVLCFAYLLIVFTRQYGVPVSNFFIPYRDDLKTIKKIFFNNAGN